MLYLKGSVIDIIADHVDFVGVPGELPTPTEILRDRDSIGELPENNVFGPYPSKDILLGTQYRILRTEGFEGLRYAVASFKKAPAMMDDVYTRVYTEVSVSTDKT